MAVISIAALRDFERAAGHFSAWLDQLEPDHCTLAEVGSALSGLLHRFPPSFLADVERPEFRMFKPNEEWQRNQRKAARLPMNGYRSQMLPNDDGNGYTLSSVAYDLSDFYEIVTNFTTFTMGAGFKYLKYLCWPYVDLRIRACIVAIEESTGPKIDPFRRLTIHGRRIRFVSWPNTTWTHATEDGEGISVASTLCGGEKAFHKHTQQQWSCYPCARCRVAL